MLQARRNIYTYSMFFNLNLTCISILNQKPFSISVVRIPLFLSKVFQSDLSYAVVRLQISAW